MRNNLCLYVCLWNDVCVRPCVYNCTCGSVCVCIPLYYYYARTQRFGKTWILTDWQVAPFKCHSMWPDYGELRTVYNPTENNNNIHCIVYHILCMWTGVVLFGNSQHNKRSAQCANLSTTTVCLKMIRFFCVFLNDSMLCNFGTIFGAIFRSYLTEKNSFSSFFEFFLNFFKHVKMSKETLFTRWNSPKNSLFREKQIGNRRFLMNTLTFWKRKYFWSNFDLKWHVNSTIPLLLHKKSLEFLFFELIVGFDWNDHVSRE